MKYSIVLFCLMLTISLYSEEFCLDNIIWQSDKKLNGMELYVPKETLSLGFYKVEKRLTNFDPNRIVYNLMDFPNYNKIFPRQKTFKLVEAIGENKFLIYSIIDFFPLKNRDYYVVLEYKKVEEDDKTSHIITWYPPNEEYKKYCNILSKDCERVSFINGRWTVVEYKNKEVFISAEIHNDWKINVSRSIMEGFEKQNAFDMVTNVLKSCSGT